MENGDKNVDRWVEERMASLEAPRWRPDTERGLARVRRKDRTVRKRRWGVSLACALALAASLFTIPGCQAATCKEKSDNLAERLWKTVFNEKHPAPPSTTRPAVAPPTPPAPKTTASAVPEKPAPAFAPVLARSFKESGSLTAAVTCEVFTDYECPACARFYIEVVPRLKAEYVDTGKVKLLHRDLPLSMHRYARMAARYANAAGLAGHYDAAVTRIFQTQSAWGLTGDIDTQLAEALAPEVMAAVRRSIISDRRLDDSVAADTAQGRADELRQTPSVVIVFRGQRQVLANPDYQNLKSVLDDTLGRR